MFENHLPSRSSYESKDQHEAIALTCDLNETLFSTLYRGKGKVVGKWSFLLEVKFLGKT